MAARTKPASPGTGGHKTPDLGAHPAREQSVAAGKAARQLAPLESHRDFAAAASRDPVGLLLGQAESRVPELVPVRHGRMLVSPFAYYRGAALPMAADLAGTRSSGLRVQLCGDAHLLNFGAFASPERRLVFDLNDFDETLPGPFEWDVKRLVASLAVAGRDNDLGTKKRRGVAVATVAAYRTAMREFAAMPVLDVWYARFDVEDALARLDPTCLRRRCAGPRLRSRKPAPGTARRRWRNYLPMRWATSAANTSPMPTASPWRSSTSGLPASSVAKPAASRAWPSVCP